MAAAGVCIVWQQLAYVFATEQGQMYCHIFTAGIALNKIFVNYFAECSIVFDSSLLTYLIIQSHYITYAEFSIL